MPDTQPPTDAAGEYHAQRKAEGAACLEAALDYLSRGWCPLPLCPPDHAGMRGHAKKCSSPGKAPWINWGEFQTRLPTPGEVRAWWKVHPDSNVGVLMGSVSGNLIGVDVDGGAGEQKLYSLSGADQPPTVGFSTGGGRRLIYRGPPGMVFRTAARHAEGGELRIQAEGSQTVMPPSRHANGTAYAWAPGRSPAEIDVAPAPGWLLRALQGGVPPTPTEAGNGDTDDPGDLFRDRTPLPESQGHAGPSPLPKGSVIVDPGRGTPTRLLKSRVNRKLIAAFDRKRTDLEDTSSSGQDMALAAAAALEGWTDQEIADALVAAAVVNGEPVKSESYYLHTVGKARSGATAARAETEEAVAEALATAREGIQSEDAATKGGARQRLVAWIASKLGVPVTAFIRYRTTPPTYRMLMNGTSLYLGEVQTILSQRDFRVKVAALSQRVVGQMKVKLWDAVAQAILDACEEEDLDEEATEDGAVRGWLRDYLRQHRPGDADLDEKGPFWEGARIGFFQVEFAKWVWEDRNEKTTKRGLGAMLRRFGCTPYRKHFPTTDGRTTRSVWLLLPESLEPPDSVDTENAH